MTMPMSMTLARSRPVKLSITQPERLSPSLNLLGLSVPPTSVRYMRIARYRVAHWNTRDAYCLK